MNRRQATRLTLSGMLALGLVVGHVPSRASPTDAQALADSDAAYLSTLLKKAVGREDVPGVVVLVVNRGSVLYQGTAGWLGTSHTQPLTTRVLNEGTLKGLTTAIQ